MDNSNVRRIFSIFALILLNTTNFTPSIKKHSACTRLESQLLDVVLSLPEPNNAECGEEFTNRHRVITVLAVSYITVASLCFVISGCLVVAMS